MASDRAKLLLEEGLQQLNLRIESAEPLLSYLALMKKWNKAINLTAITDSSEMVIKHLLDSLAIIPIIDELIEDSDKPRVLDVGSGGGLPGIPLAILRPTLSMTLCESIAKKCAFLNQVKTTLNLTNVTVKNARVEDLDVNKPYNVITARAVATVDKLYALTQHLSLENTSWCLMKSQQETETLPEIPGKKTQLKSVQVPFLNAERTVVLITK